MKTYVFLRSGGKMRFIKAETLSDAYTQLGPKLGWTLLRIAGGW